MNGLVFPSTRLLDGDCRGGIVLADGSALSQGPDDDSHSQTVVSPRISQDPLDILSSCHFINCNEHCRHHNEYKHCEVRSSSCLGGGARAARHLSHRHEVTWMPS